MDNETQLVKTEVSRNLFLTPVMNVALAKARLQEFQEFIAGYLTESKDGGEDGGDYGIIPGTKKKTLLKSGAEKLMEIYGLYDEYETEFQIENFESGLFFYRLKCILKLKRDDSMAGTGMGACSSFESKYRWRDSQRKCPACGAAAIIKGKKEFIKKDGAGYWLCFAKKGGCGTGFKEGDQDIEGQILGRVENPDIIDIANTVLKMGKKRAKIDAVISVTRSSGIFSQDLDDITLPTTAHNGHSSQPQPQGSIEGELVEEKGKKKYEPRLNGPILTDEDHYLQDKEDERKRQEGKGQFKRAFDHEISKKTEKLLSLVLLPCFTDEERDTICNKRIPNIKTLETVDKLLSWAESIAKKRTKEQAKKDKEAELGKQLEIGAEEAVYADSDQAF